MTVSVQTPFASYVAAGSPTFVYGFRILDASHLVVKANGVLQVLGVDYTVTGVGLPAGGTVVFTVAPSVGVVVTIQRKTPFARTTDYQNNGDLLTPVVNADFDACWLALQDAQFTGSLAVLLAAGDTAAPMTLPSVALRANGFLAFDASGNAVTAAGVTGLPATSFIAPFLLTTTAAAARAAISAAASGAITASGLTQSTARLLGRTTAATGPVEEIVVGTGLTLAGGALSADAVQILSLPNPTLAANALTLPAATLSLQFRSATASDGVVPAAISGTIAALTIPSGATLGTVSGVTSSIIEVVMNNAGTLERAVINLAGGNNLSEAGFISTTAISAAATSASVFYSNTARSNLPYRVVRRIDSTQATAGTWATSPSLVQGVGGQFRVGVSYTSSNQTITSGGTLTLAHGLGQIPTKYWVELICLSAELGFSAGNRFDPRNVDWDSGGANASRGVRIVPDATNLNIVISAQANAFVAMDGAGNGSVLTNGNWAMIFRAEL